MIVWHQRKRINVLDYFLMTPIIFSYNSQHAYLKEIHRGKKRDQYRGFRFFNRFLLKQHNKDHQHLQTWNNPNYWRWNNSKREIIDLKSYLFISKWFFFNIKEINNQLRDDYSDTSEDIGNGEGTTEAQRAENEFYSSYCAIFLQKQSHYLVTTYNNICLLQFTQGQSNEL